MFPRETSPGADAAGYKAQSFLRIEKLFYDGIRTLLQKHCMGIGGLTYEDIAPPNNALAEQRERKGERVYHSTNASGKLLHSATTLQGFRCTFRLYFFPLRTCVSSRKTFFVASFFKPKRAEKKITPQFPTPRRNPRCLLSFDTLCP